MQGVAFSSQPGITKRRGRGKSGESGSLGEEWWEADCKFYGDVRNRSWLRTRAQEATVEKLGDGEPRILCCAGGW